MSLTADLDETTGKLKLKPVVSWSHPPLGTTKCRNIAATGELQLFRVFTFLLFINSAFMKFFPSMFFCGEAAKKTSIDGLKWRDLVGVVVGR